MRLVSERPLLESCAETKSTEIIIRELCGDYCQTDICVETIIIDTAVQRPILERQLCIDTMLGRQMSRDQH